ncbi:MAG: HEAT repeat domain-containing protein [Actinobacteria bacterium]|nr:HEAT repeat domain-containing protein [Actinomycetota bacterium]
MKQALFVSVLVFGAGVGSLALFILANRLASTFGRRKQERLRPHYAEAIASFLAADDGAKLPSLPDWKAARQAFWAVALEALVELEGRERDRLTHALEDSGLVADATYRLWSRRRRVRRQAADALALVRSERGAGVLLAGLDDSDRFVRLGCARALAELGDESFQRRILETVGLEASIETLGHEAEVSPGLVAEVLLALGPRGARAVAHISTSARSEHLRRVAVAVLAALRLPAYAPLLRAALASRDDGLTVEAARGLAALGDVEAVDVLLDVMRDRDRPAFVAAEAASALGKIGDPRAVPVLEAALRSDTWSLQSSAAEALAELGGDGADALQRAIRSGRPLDRAHALAALDR